MRRLALAAVIAGAVAAPATAFVEPVTRLGDLDGDPPLETVEAV